MLAERSAGKLKNVEFVGLVSNKANCLAVERAKSADIPVFIIRSNKRAERVIEQSLPSLPKLEREIEQLEPHS